MGLNEIYITIPLINGLSVDLKMVAESPQSIFAIEELDAKEKGESPYQIVEGYCYEYKLCNEAYVLEENMGIVTQSKLNKSCGGITPNIYVGTLLIYILDATTQKECGKFELEVRSVKVSYREDYRHMLEEITGKCTDLIMQYTSPVYQNFTIDFGADSDTLYQRFAFIKSVLDSEEFSDSIHKVVAAPVTKWTGNEINKDLRAVKRITNHSIRQIVNAPNRIRLTEDHPLYPVVPSLPAKIKVRYKKETVDTPENRFIKYVLSSFATFCNDISSRMKEGTRLKREATQLEDKLQQYLNHSIFKEIGDLTSLPLNSPILQRKEGYREIFKSWLMFDLAAKIIWKGGDDIYSGGKKDVAALYEYWIFFKLLEVIGEIFKIEPQSLKELIKPTKDGLGLQLKQGNYFPLKGVYINDTRSLNITFGYNRTFTGESNYPHGGSWTRNLRPDYTLSIWPLGIDAEQAEKEELIVHIHFDAKYKIENWASILGSVKKEDEIYLMNEKEEQNKGTYKRADILKMHTYRDAIRRTGGAYILYPGTESNIKKGFHELLPGLGAFAIRPSKDNNGLNELKSFLTRTVEHFLNRASQRERIALKIYETHKDNPINQVNEALPEVYGENRSLLPDETFVLVAYYKSKEHLQWIINNSLYNARTENARGTLRLGSKEAGAKYLLLHTAEETITNKLFKVTEAGATILSKHKLIEKEYPSKPSQDFYLVYRIEMIRDKEFINRAWQITKLPGFKTGRDSALPFAVTLTELMSVVTKE